MMYLGPMKYRVCWLILIQASCHRRPEVAMERPELAPLLRLWDGLGNAVGGLPTTRQRLLRLTGEAWSDDRTVRAVVGPRGHLVELQIDPRVYRRPDATELAATVVEVSRRAVVEVNRAARQLIEAAVPAELRGAFGDD